MDEPKEQLLTDERDPYYEGGPFDKKNPKSLLNLMPKECLKVLYDVPLEKFYWTTEDFEKKLRPSVRLSQIRIAFWKEYDSAHSSMSKMTLKGIVMFLDGLPSVYVQDCLQNVEYLPYILCPPTSYSNLVEEALSRGLSRLREIMDLPIVDPLGNVDAKTVELILKATAFLDVRVHGMPMQRTEQTIKSLSVNVNRKDLKQLGSTQPRLEDIDAQIKALEDKMTPMKEIDVDPS